MPHHLSSVNLGFLRAEERSGVDTCSAVGDSTLSERPHFGGTAACERLEFVSEQSQLESGESLCFRWRRLVD